MARWRLSLQSHCVSHDHCEPALQVVGGERERTYTLGAASVDTQTQWVSALRAAARAAAAAARTARVMAGVPPPSKSGTCNGGRDRGRSAEDAWPAELVGGRRDVAWRGLEGPLPLSIWRSRRRSSEF
jgi:hypothetical protein